MLPSALIQKVGEKKGMPSLTCYRDGLGDPLVHSPSSKSVLSTQLAGTSMMPHLASVWPCRTGLQDPQLRAAAIAPSPHGLFSIRDHKNLYNDVSSDLQLHTGTFMVPHLASALDMALASLQDPGPAAARTPYGFTFRC